MKQILLSFALATAGAVLILSVPSDGYSYQPYRPWNRTSNSTHWYPQQNGTGYVPYRFNGSGLNPAYNRNPRSTPYSQNTSHNYFWGHKSIYDRLLYFTRVKKASSFMRKVTQDIDFPAKYQRPNGTISYIEVLDQKTAGDGGEASILRGGIRYQNVTVHLKSQRNKGFDFAIYIYGH